MYNQQDDVITNEVLALSNVSIEQFCTLETGSDAQKDYANSLKIQALATIWQGIKPSMRTAQFANAVLHSFAQKQESRFWIDNKAKFGFCKSTLSLFSADIKAALEA